MPLPPVRIVSFLVWFALAGLFAGLLASGATPVWAIKPVAPLALSVDRVFRQDAPPRPDGPRVPDGLPRLILTASARVDCDAVTLSFDLPAGVERVEGDEWTGSLPRGESKTIEIQVRASEEALPSVVGEATARCGTLGVLTQRAWLPYATAPAPAPPPITQFGDEAVLEFPGE